MSMLDPTRPEAPASSPPWRRLAVVGVGVASSLFFLWFVLRRADLGNVWAAVREADLGLLLAAALVVELVYVAQASRWRVIAATPSVSRRHFLALVLAGIASNNVLPLRIGDLLRGRWLAKAATIATGRALGTVFRDRLSDVVVLVVGLVVTLPVVGTTAWGRHIAIGGAALLVLCGLVIGGALAYTARRPRAGRGERSLLRRVVRDVLDEIASPIGRRRIVAALAFSVVAWTVWAAAAGLVCRSLGFHLSPVELVFVTCVINLGVAIPSSPGFVGTYQWLGVSALGAVGIDSDLGLAFALLMQAIWFVPTTVVGGPIALHEGGRDVLGRRSPTATPAPSDVPGG
jgi:glycosyltransferase 2 family protein